MAESLRSKVYETGVKGYMYLELARVAAHFPPPLYSEAEREKAEGEKQYVEAFGGLLRMQLGTRLYEKMTNEAAERIFGLIAAVDEI